MKEQAVHTDPYTWEEVHLVEVRCICGDPSCGFRTLLRTAFLMMGPFVVVRGAHVTSLS